MSSYDGGKGGMGVWQWIINQMPVHDIYVEAFLGNGAVLRHKRPAASSIGIELNPAVVAERWTGHGLPGCIVVCADALSFLDRDWSLDTFIYLDPPYLMETRSSQRQLYEFELAEREQHLALLDLIKRLNCMVAISGYYSPLYAEQLPGWRTSTFWTVNRAGKRVQEWLWMNYPTPLALHDYRFLGRDFRERERIKRKKARWTARLRTMPALERYALLDALSSLGGSSISPDLAREARTAGNDDSDETSTSSVEPPTIEILSPDLAMAAAIAGCDEGIPSPDLAMDDGTALEEASLLPSRVDARADCGDGRPLKWVLPDRAMPDR